MSWLQQLADDLTRRGIRGRDRRRIVAELRDHIACDPEGVARLGDPTALAGMFADELATARTRRSALKAFVALAFVAVVVGGSQLALGRVGYPGFDHGLSQFLFWPALLGTVVASQAALVAGTLAALRAWRRRRSHVLPAAELALIARRTRVALLAGGGTAVGTALYSIDFAQRLPVWWTAPVAGAAVLSGAGLVVAWRGVTDATAITAGAPGPAGDVFDDLPVLRRGWLRGRWRLGVAASLLVGLVMTVFEAHAERSLSEGIQRGAVEGLCAAVGFLVLGKAIGLASPGARALTGSLTIGLPSHRVSDRDRDHAEQIVRDSYAVGRLTLDELSARVEAVHDARTLGELRATLADLPESQ